MDQQDIAEILSGRRRTPGAAVLRSLLLPVSWPYGWAMALRRCCYRREIVSRRSAPVPVISVGNVTTGGTGKTPMVAWVVGRLAEAGASPAIITRGYRPSAGRSDEAELLGRLTGCPVVVNCDRAAAANEASARGADVLVMDDGFQHLRLARDLDIVLIDATRPFGYGYCLPRGLLREPLRALRAADAVVITRSDEVAGEQLARLRGRAAELAPAASIHLAVHEPTRLEDRAGRQMPPDALAGRRVFAFCGIGNPGSFFRCLEHTGAELLCRRALDDHVDYIPQVTEPLRKAAADSEAEMMVTTQKDFVKLSHADFGRELWQLVVEMKVTEGLAELTEKVTTTWAKAKG